MVFAQEPEFQRYQDRLKEYEYASKKVSTEYIDPDKKPAVAQQNQIQQYGTIVFDYKGRTERVTSDTEQDITNGIIKVVSAASRGRSTSRRATARRTPTSAERDGYNAIAAALGRENYTVDKLVLAQTGRGARRRGGGRRRRAEDRLLPAGNRGAEEVSGQGGQAAARARSAGQGRTARR